MTATVPAAAPPTTSDDAAAVTPAWRLALPGMAIALVLAVIGLGRLPLWLDESLSLGATNQLEATLRGTGGTMAGYYLVLTPWASVSEAVWWLRLPSVAFAVATSLPLAALARRIGGDALAVRTAVIAGLSVGLTRYAQEARSYALVMLLVATLVWATVRAVDAGPGADRRWWRWCTVLGACLVLGHGLSVLAVLAVAVALALAPDPRRLLVAFAPTVLLSTALVAWLWTLGADKVGSWVPEPDAEQVRELVRTLASPFWWAAVPLLALVVAGIALASRSTAGSATDRWVARLPGLWLVLPIAGLVALSVVRPSLLARYVVFVVPAIALLLARVTVAVDERLTGRAARPVGVALVVVAALLLPGQVEVHTRSGDDWRGAAEVVAAGAEAGDGLHFPQTYHRTPFEAGWQELADRPETAPEPVDTARPLGPVRRHDWPLAADEIDTRLLAHDRVWVVAAHEPGQLVDARQALEDRSDVMRRFRIARHVQLGGSVEVLLLVAR